MTTLTSPVARSGSGTVAAIRRLADAIYPEGGSDFAEQALDLMAARERSTQSRHRPGADEVILITYPDLLRAPGEHPLQTLGRFCRQYLPFIPVMHLLPFYPQSSDEGFSVVDYEAVDPALGDWSDIAALAGDVRLMFDAVINHVSAQSQWMQQYLAGRPPFDRLAIEVAPEMDVTAVVRPRESPLVTRFDTAAGARDLWTTFSPDQVDLNYADPRVLLAILGVLLDYVDRGASFIRLDAVAFIWKQAGTGCMSLPTTHRIVQLIRAVLDAVAPQVSLVCETNVPHAENVSYFGDGRNEAQLVYNFALPPLVLHTFGTGNSTALQGWASGLALPGPDAWFLNFLASHDGIGLRGVESILSRADRQSLAERALARGGFVGYRSLPDGQREPYELNINYFDALSEPDRSESLDVEVSRFLTAHSIMLTLPGVPGLYAHSLLGSRGDRLAVLRSGDKRAVNRARLQLNDLTAELASDPRRRAIFDGLAALLAARAACPELDPAADCEVLATSPALFALRRDQRLTAVHNVRATPQALPWGGLDLLSGQRFQPGDDLPGYAVVWLR